MPDWVLVLSRSLLGGGGKRGQVESEGQRGRNGPKVNPSLTHFQTGEEKCPTGVWPFTLAIPSATTVNPDNDSKVVATILCIS